MAAKAAQITGLVLAGGFGRRLGGIDKGWVQYRGRPLIESVVERFAPQRARTDWITIVPCDAPHLPADLVERLAGAVGAADAACARVDGRLPPVFALVRPSTSALLGHQFTAG